MSVNVPSGVGAARVCGRESVRTLCQSERVETKSDDEDRNHHNNDFCLLLAKKSWSVNNRALCNEMNVWSTKLHEPTRLDSSQLNISLHTRTWAYSVHKKMPSHKTTRHSPLLSAHSFFFKSSPLSSSSSSASCVSVSARLVTSIHHS